MNQLDLMLPQSANTKHEAMVCAVDHCYALISQKNKDHYQVINSIEAMNNALKDCHESNEGDHIINQTEQFKYWIKGTSLDVEKKVVLIRLSCERITNKMLRTRS